MTGVLIMYNSVGTASATLSAITAKPKTTSKPSQAVMELMFGFIPLVLTFFMIIV